MAQIIIHAIKHGEKEVHAAGERLSYEPPPRFVGPDQQAYLTFYIEWDQGINRAGPFRIPVPHPDQRAENHYDLVLKPEVVLAVAAEIRGDEVGLRRWRGSEPAPEARVWWGESTESKLTRLPLRTMIGNTVPEHFVLLVQSGMTIAATSFFTDQLGWYELGEQRIDADWGKVRFVMPRAKSRVRIQLTELAGRTADALPAVHLGLSVYDPERAAFEIEEWGTYCGIPIETEPLEGGKWFVTLPSIFATKFEFVPAIVTP